MIKIFIAAAEGVYDRLDEILNGELGYSPTVVRTAAGKPYIEGNPLFFSITHSGKRAAIAVCEKPVGIDLELYKDNPHDTVKSSFTPAEQEEISGERDFLKHWTAREAFVKMRGETLAQTLKSIEYVGGNLYFKGERQEVEIFSHVLDYGVLTVCTEKCGKIRRKK